jgi:hypothetical protein
MAKVLLKRTTVAARVPTTAQCDAGELLVNLADKLLYTKDGSGNIITLPGAIGWSAITGKPTTLSGYGITDAAAQKATASVYGGMKASLVGSTLTLTTT